MNKEVHSQTQHSRTSATLLHRLRVAPDDETAWKQFMHRYEPLVLQWCSRRGLAHSDARDVAQNVMLKMAQVMRNFEYDSSKSFRAWLKTITHRAWYDWQQKEQKQPGRSSESGVLSSIEARDDLVERLQHEYDAEIMEFAVLRVRMRVSQPSWRAFELTAIQGMAGVEAAKVMNIDVARVYVDKSRITKMLAEEVGKLDSEQ